MTLWNKILTLLKRRDFTLKKQILTPLSSAYRSSYILMQFFVCKKTGKFFTECLNVGPTPLDVFVDYLASDKEIKKRFEKMITVQRTGNEWINGVEHYHKMGKEMQ